MANRLAMDKTQGILQLFAAGMSERQIARTLDIDRKSVDRELRLQGAKGARSTKAPTGPDSLGSEGPKGAKAPTGGEAPDSAVVESSKNATEGTPASDPNPSRSQCQAFHDLIIQKLELRLDAQRVYQDLVRDHGFPGSYYSVRRYVRHLGNRLVDPVRRIELPPAEEMHVDYGMGVCWIIGDLSNKEMEKLYERRWGVELQFRALKQTFDRRKVRCRCPERVLAEIEWSIFGMAAIELMGIKVQMKDVDARPEKLRFSQALTAVRHCLNNLTDCPEFLKVLYTGLRSALIDSYERKKLKSGRYKPKQKKKPSCGEPNIERATNQRQRHREISLQNAA